MLIFWRLLFGHLLGDFTLQTNYIAQWKQKSLWGMLVHCGIHPVLYALLCRPFLDDIWVNTEAVRLNGWACIALLFILHFIEDEWRVFMISQRRIEDDTLFFLFDQAFHAVCLIALLPAGLWGRGDGLFPEVWPLLGCLAVLATHGTTVLLFYVEKELFDGTYPEFDEKHFTIAERFVFGTCFLLPGVWGFVAPAAWGILAYQARLALSLDYSWFGFYIGLLCAGVCGLLAGFVF
jgi:hypothetical protein